MSKLIKDGKVAVLVAGGFGAGWSTWNREHPNLVFHKGIAEYIDKNGSITKAIAEEIVGELDEHVCFSGASDLEIEWVDVGTAFRITEYDGSESLEIISQIEHYIA